jgi:hypothetical protein
MKERTKQALTILKAALLLGVLGDALMRATPWGLNVLLWVGAIVGAVLFLLSRWRPRALTGGGHLLLLAAVMFAAAFAWRDSVTLNFLAGLGAALSLGLMAWRARDGRIWLAGLTEYALGWLVAGLNAFLIGFPALFGDLRWREVPLAGWSRHLRAIGLGALIALPLLILFGGLLMAADKAFERMLVNLFAPDQGQAFGHILVALALAWITGGCLRGLLLGKQVKVVDGRAVLASFTRPENPQAEISDAAIAPQRPFKTEQLNLGIVEIGVTLGLLNLLFLTFVLMQLRYFFGDAALVQGSDGLTFSEYYRRGFFELVAVAGLVLPLLLGLHWLLRKNNPAHERIFRALAGFQVFLLFVIMASAFRRMLLYQSEYGLTELRLYTTAFMLWLALVFIWFVATALRGRREQFACGALVAGLLVIAALHVINPDALIVRVNLAHASKGTRFDAEYASSLSADAAPALFEGLALLPDDDRRIIAAGLLEDSSSEMGADWRTWNWARAERRRIARANASVLETTAARPIFHQEAEAPELKQEAPQSGSEIKPPVNLRKNVEPHRKAAPSRGASRRKPPRKRSLSR